MKLANKGYAEIIRTATGCPEDRTGDVYDAICHIGGFTALDQLTRAQIAKAAKAAWLALEEPEPGASRPLTPVRDIADFAVIIRAIHERGATQADAVAELARRGLWLTEEQKKQAGLS